MYKPLALKLRSEERKPKVFKFLVCNTTICPPPDLSILTLKVYFLFTPPHAVPPPVHPPISQSFLSPFFTDIVKNHLLRQPHLSSAISLQSFTPSSVINVV